MNCSFFLYFQDKLTDIKDEWSQIKGTLEYNILNSLCQNKETGYCDCKECIEDETVNLPSECPDLTSKCNRYSKTTGIMYLGTHITMFDSLGKWTTGNGTKMAIRTRQNMKFVLNSPGKSPVSHVKL